MTGGLLRQRAALLRAIPLEDVLRAVGARPDQKDRAKWHTQRGVLSVTGCKFMNWRSGCGGGGAIDLAMHLLGLDFKATLSWLGERFGGACGGLRPAAPVEVFRPPPPQDRNLDRVRAYLSAERGLDPALFEPLIEAGTLYADTRANAVFLLCSPGGQAVGAELRGTAMARWRGLAPGSRKNRGYFSVGSPESLALVLCESAIDALSCQSLHPQARCLSTSGATPQPRWLPGLLAQGHEVYCGFDTDEVGECHAAAMLAAYPGVRRLRPTHHDWNDQLRAHPKAFLWMAPR